MIIRYFYTKIICARKGHVVSLSSCPFTGYTYTDCVKCGSRKVEKTQNEFR